MKTVIRSIAIYLFALYFLPQMIPGFTMDGGFGTMITAAITLALMFLVLKPILNVISFPVNMVTLGLFSIITNAFILYLLTVIVPEVTVQPFSYPRFELFGVIIPKLTFNTFFAYVYSAFVLATINTVIRWLIK
jgi:putative membrane protein